MKKPLLSTLVFVLAGGASAASPAPPAAGVSADPTLTRASAPVRGSFANESLAKVLGEMGTQAGVNVLFDRDYRDRQVSIRVDGQTFGSALEQLTVPNQVFHKALSTTTIAIAPDAPFKRRVYGAWVEPPPMPQAQQRGTVALDFQDVSLRTILGTLAGQAGLNLVFDEDYRDVRVSVHLQGEAVETALGQLALVHGLLYKAIDPGTLLIAPDSPAKRWRYLRPPAPSGSVR